MLSRYAAYFVYAERQITETCMFTWDDAIDRLYKLYMCISGEVSIDDAIKVFQSDRNSQD